MIENKLNKKIITLPQSVANRIAAGEVVERPAAVVKELIENSIDAGASKISVIIEDAGRTLIKVVDDGAGMTGADLAVSVGRHATSKLERFEDLESLTTFGFRGEALPSIAAVSRLDIVSRTRSDDVGTTLNIAGGKVEKCEPVSTTEGTSISVGHLFYNVPARRKFLKTDATEFKWIANIFKYFALAFPDIAWELFHKGDLIYKLQASDSKDRVAGLFGEDVAEEMIRIGHNIGWLEVSGWVSPFNLAQRTNTDQYLFLNNRPIKSARLNHAVNKACEPYYTDGGYPLYIIMLKASPERFDINIHPAKKEVKFADESGAYSTLRLAVGKAFSETGRPKELGKSEESKSSPVPPGISEVRSPVEAPSHLTPLVPFQSKPLKPRGPLLPFPKERSKWLPVEGKETTESKETADSNDAKRSPVETDDDGPVIWQIFETYLISPLKTGLAFIDQHVAHERILYERALKAIEREPWSSQQILFPVAFSVPREDIPFIEECLPLLKAMGFGIESAGLREFRIYASPSGIRIANERVLILDIIEEYKENIATETDPRKRLAAAFACKSAVKAGQPLEPLEMRRLVDELFRTDDPEFCPHGRPIYHVLNRREIDKWFRR